MLVVSDTASQELSKVMGSDQAQSKNLIIFLAGAACGGPQLGLALDDAVENFQKLESNGVTAYIEPNLHKETEKMGDITIDFVTNDLGQTGYKIFVGEPGGGCGSCSCGC